MKQQKKILRGEAALVLAVIINSLGVLLMLQSGSGISAISSVPYAFQQVFPKLTLGTWTYLFQGLLICILMIMRKKFVNMMIVHPFFFRVAVPVSAFGYAKKICPILFI